MYAFLLFGIADCLTSFEFSLFGAPCRFPMEMACKLSSVLHCDCSGLLLARQPPSRLQMQLLSEHRKSDPYGRAYSPIRCGTTELR